MQRAHCTMYFKWSIVHSRRRSNVFGDGRFLILPKSNQICPNLNHFCPNLSIFFPNFAQIYSNFAKKKILGNSAASQAHTALV